MISTQELLKQGRKSEVWTRYCGYFELTMDEFMEIQERLLMEQIDLLYSSKIGRHFMSGKKPTSIEEFRNTVPLTTYEDYIEFLGEKNSDSLPEEPVVWARTSGRSNANNVKWVPYSKGMYDRHGESVIGGMILSAAKYKGDVQLEIGDKLLLASAPPPYSTGILSHSLSERFNIRFLPSLEEGEAMNFSDRIGEGFDQAMEHGLDYFFGIASVLVKVGEQFENSRSKKNEHQKMPPIRSLFRIIKGAIKAKIEKRNLLPRDMWKVKGIMAGGTDTVIYRKILEHYWGQKPLEGYSCTEGLSPATHSWLRTDMTFYPDMDFLEFIPYDDYLKSKSDPSYLPKTVLHNELELGIYEIVFTNFHGGVLMRYRVGDLLEIVAYQDEELNIQLPQCKFYSRADDMINIAGLATFTETHIWEIVADSGIPYEDWTARKELENGEPFLHLYVELKKDVDLPLTELNHKLRQSIEKLNDEFADMEEIMGRNCFKVTQLPDGAFRRYMQEQMANGADLGHTKPAHMKPSEKIINRLLKKTH